jgi:dTMP kinase
VAVSSAKVDANPPLTIEWCQSPDVGLPAPDVVIFLDLSQEEAEQRGGYVRCLSILFFDGIVFLTWCKTLLVFFFVFALCSYGDERYEKRDTQIRVRQRFNELQERGKRVPWHIVNAAQTMEKVHEDILKIVEDTVKDVHNDKPLEKLWTDGEYALMKPGEE